LTFHHFNYQNDWILVDTDDQAKDSTLQSLPDKFANLEKPATSSTDNVYGRWLESKKASMSLNKAAVALANKNARIIWSLLKTGSEFDLNGQQAAA